jgi:hypothetical protein
MDCLGPISNTRVLLPVTQVPEAKGIASIFTRKNWFRHPCPGLTTRVVTIILGIAGVAVVYFLYRFTNRPPPYGKNLKKDSRLGPETPPAKSSAPASSVEVQRPAKEDPIKKQEKQTQALIEKIGEGDASKAYEKVMALLPLFEFVKKLCTAVEQSTVNDLEPLKDSHKKEQLTTLRDELNKIFISKPPSLGVQVNMILSLNEEYSLFAPVNSMINNNCIDKLEIIELNHTIDRFADSYLKAATNIWRKITS